MSTPALVIRVQGLDKLDQLELNEQFEPGAVHFEESVMSDGKHGELVTTAVVVVSVLGLKVLAAWLIKSRTKEKFKKTIEIFSADGSKRVETIEVDFLSSTAPKESVLKELARLCNVDLGFLQGDKE
jgi:hypothetical protein